MRPFDIEEKLECRKRTFEIISAEVSSFSTIMITASMGDLFDEARRTFEMWAFTTELTNASNGGDEGEVGGALAKCVIPLPLDEPCADGGLVGATVGRQVR